MIEAKGQQLKLIDLGDAEVPMTLDAARECLAKDVTSYAISRPVVMLLKLFIEKLFGDGS